LKELTKKLQVLVVRLAQLSIWPNQHKPNSIPVAVLQDTINMNTKSQKTIILTK
jgi:hypothetical protein